MNDAEEVHYVFVKGQGWVARPGPEPEPAPEPPLTLTGDALQTYGQRLREAARQYWAGTWETPRVTTTTTTTAPVTYRLTYQTHNDIWYYDNTPWHQPRPRTREPAQGTPREPARARYFPGSNTPAEPLTIEETPRERQIREYRERIARRGRRP